MTSGQKPQEFYRDQYGVHPVFPVSAIIQPDEIKDSHIDWGTGAGQVSAADLPIADAGGWTEQIETEAVIQEILGSNTESIKAGFNVSGGGTVSLSAASLFKWTARIIVISAGRGSHFGTSGYFDIDMPTSGTLTGVGGTSDQTWTANGCTLSAWLALYYILPIGSNYPSVDANFRIASYTSDLKVPSTWLLIAVRNAGGLAPAKVCNGMTLLAGESRVFGGQPAPSTVILSAGSPYSLVAYAYEQHIITATTNPYIINLPQASACVGYRARIVAANPATTGLVKIVPYSGDAIGSIGADVAVYLQNVDQSGFAYRFQFIDLIATVSGYWAVIAGQFCPDQSVDTDGQQYHLGKLHHMPQGNTTSRQVYSAAPPTAGNYSAAITGVGSLGVPAGAKALRLRADITLYAAAAGAAVLALCITDNNSNAPSYYTAHAQVRLVVKAVAAADLWSYASEIDVPLNASGQFYIYTLTATNVTVASCSTYWSVMGYYMGD